MAIGSKEICGWRTPLVTTVWGVSLFAVLQIQHLPVDAAHSVCGPWGCGPPLPPLIASHAFWLVLLSLPTGLLCRRLEPRPLRRTGWLLLAAGLSGLAAVGIWELIPSLPHWLPRVGNLPPRYYLHRYLLSLATLVEVPIVPLTLAGLSCLLTAGARRQRAQTIGERTSPTTTGRTLEIPL